MTTTSALLGKHIASSDPSSPDQQRENLERIALLRRGLPSRENHELGTILDLAATLTEYLIRLGGLGPQDVLEIIAGMVDEVEVRTHSTANVPKPERRVELSAPAGSPTLQLAGPGRASMNSKLLGEILIRLGTITPEQRDRARAMQQATGVRLGEALVSIGATDWDGVTKGLTIQKQITGSI